MNFSDFFKSKKNTSPEVPKDFYNLSAKDIDGKDFSFASLKGKKLLLVNVASKCGFTPQYAELEKLYKEFGGERFEIIGFPSNDFLKQESGTEKEIKEFCQLNYGVSFPMMSKIKVRGNSKHPVYQWLTSKRLNGYKDSKVKWNFQKYLISPQGKIADIIAPRESPYSEKILKFIQN
ncbi:MAG: glutathione peroxidase [Bacteroidales bacterium]|nr:glutathione peroxidase [Bacteroidales bacterium]